MQDDAERDEDDQHIDIQIQQFNCYLLGYDPRTRNKPSKPIPRTGISPIDRTRSPDNNTSIF